MIQFKRASDSRYISASKFSLVEHNGSYFMLVNSRIPHWPNMFSSIECAETFLNSHDYIKASISHMPMSADDIEFIIEMYGFDNVGYNKWELTEGNKTYYLSVGPEGDSLKISESERGKLFKNKYTFNETVDALDYLDSISASTQFIRCSSLAEFKQMITAAGRSAREITKNLVRVKSSNIWAYAIDIKDRHNKTGTVYVQFKGKNGGPNGGLYCYYNVPINVWRQFITYPSKGHFFYENIRNRYKYSKLDGDKRGKLPNAINYRS